MNRGDEKSRQMKRGNKKGKHLKRGNVKMRQLKTGKTVGSCTPIRERTSFVSLGCPFSPFIGIEVVYCR